MVFLSQISELKKNLEEKPVVKMIQLKVRKIEKQTVFPTNSSISPFPSSV